MIYCTVMEENARKPLKSDFFSFLAFIYCFESHELLGFGE